MNMTSICQVCLRVPLKSFPIAKQIRIFFISVLKIKLKKDSELCCECRGLSIKFFKYYNKCQHNNKILEDSHNQQALPSNIDASLNCERFSLVQISIEYADISKPLKTETEESEFMKLEENNVSDEEVPLVKYIKEEHIPPQIEVTKTKSASKKSTKAVSSEQFAEVLHLDEGEQRAEFVRRSTSLNYLNSPFKCELCFRGFLVGDIYQKHMLKHDERYGTAVCGICSLRHRSARLLRAHVLHSHERRFKCKKCGHLSHTASQAHDHEKWHGGFLYVCDICGETFRKPTSHLTHMRKSHRSGYACPQCGDSFLSPKGLQMHIAKTHIEVSNVTAPDDRWYCQECQMQFASETAHRKHFQTSTNHSGDYSLACKTCGVLHASRLKLREHNAASHQTEKRLPDESRATITCDQCGAVFATKSKCSQHIKRTHLGIKYSKDIVCELCGRKCSTASSLRLHQRSHTGERPYRCTECAKCFRNSSQLRVHTRLHTGEKPYQCSHCEKNFRQKPALNRHTRVHTGEKPYKCVLCDKRFSQSNSLKIHFQSMHHKIKDKKT